MPRNPRIRRLALVPVEGPHDELRRYRLARMDELALATPPDPSIVQNGSGPRPAGDALAATPPGEPARPAPR